MLCFALIAEPYRRQRHLAEYPASSKAAGPGVWGVSAGLVT